jgi:hypothetical protein
VKSGRSLKTSETLVNFYQTTRRYNLEDSHHQNYSIFPSVNLFLLLTFGAIHEALLRIFFSYPIYDSSGFICIRKRFEHHLEDSEIPLALKRNGSWVISAESSTLDFMPWVDVSLWSWLMSLQN